MNWRVLLAHLRKYSTKKIVTKTKLSASLEESIEEAVKNETMHPKRHPGRFKMNAVVLPDKYKDAIRIVLEEHPLDSVREDANLLLRYLHHRRPPVEEHELREKEKEIQQRVELERGIDINQYDKETQEHIRESHKHIVKHYMKAQLYNWTPVDYNHYVGLQYLIGRGCAEYAALLKIFTEVKIRCPDFKPQSLFDFGSGVGTVSWVAERLFGSSLREIYNVDSSGEMNDLADRVLRGGDINNQQPVKSILYRQFLPAQHKIKYDIVVSAYTLLDLPSYKTRLETILNLWCKTERFLVLVERGTNAGFQVINEARDFLLDLMPDGKGKSNNPPLAHVFSPCPHDMVCPRYVDHYTPCHFEIKYFNSPAGIHDAIKEHYTYVIFERGPRPDTDPQWPRLVSSTLKRGKHAVCRMCTPAGKLGEIIFTAKRHGKYTYRCARQSRWGDLLPVNLSSAEYTVRDWSDIDLQEENSEEVSDEEGYPSVSQEIENREQLENNVQNSDIPREK